MSDLPIDRTSDESPVLPKMPEPLNTGRFAETLWGYAGLVGSADEMGRLYERDCKEFAMEALRKIMRRTIDKRKIFIAKQALDAIAETQK